jgi:1A family penicillin-binding protein
MANWKRLWRKRVLKIKQFSRNYRVRNKADLIRLLAVAGFFAILGFFLVGTVLFAWYAKDLPQPDKVVRREGFSTKIYDRNGELLYDVFADQRRTPVELSQVPEYLRQATVAVEDKNFYKHQGFDPWGWARAVFNSVFRFRRLAGGSTLTQQLVKNVLLSPKRTLARKIKEFVLSVQIEKKYTKDEILQMYLNEAPYGGTAWGAEAAAETYFGKNVSELSLIESAILAGLPQSPTNYSPFTGTEEAYKNRTKDVLRRMREDGYISKDQEKQALEDLDKVEFAPEGASFKAPHFVMYVKQELVERYGERMVEQGGLKVTTSLDWEIQKQTQEIVTEQIKNVESLHITNGAALVADPLTGEILAMVGSKDYAAEDYDGKVNVTLSLRQPGSAIKPVTYVTAFKQGYTPATMIADVITEFPGGANNPVYKPKNYNGKVNGPIQLRYALGSSINIASVKLLQLVGVRNMLETAYRMGFTTLEPTQANVNRFGLSVTLGGGEVRLLDMVMAYSAFANAGLKVEPVTILKVEDNKGKVLEEYKPVKGQRVLSEEEAFLVCDILSDNEARLLTFGANSLLRIPGQQVAVKTGTTDDMRDNWAVGWTPAVIVGAWVGNNDNTQMKGVASGVSGATPIWRQIMLAALKIRPIKTWSMPSGIVTKEVDKISGYPSHDGFPSRTEYFIKGVEPYGEDPIHAKLKVCRGENKRAPETKIARGDYEEKEYIILEAADPAGGDRNRWQEGIDAWIATQSDERYHYPKEYCGDSNSIVIQFSDPEDKARINSNSVEVKLKVVADQTMDKVELYVDGSKRETLVAKPYETVLSLSNGSHTLKARALDEKGNVAEAEIKIGINQDWDYVEPTPSPSATTSGSLLPRLSLVYQQAWL